MEEVEDILQEIIFIDKEDHLNEEVEALKQRLHVITIPANRIGVEAHK